MELLTASPLHGNPVLDKLIHHAEVGFPFCPRQQYQKT